MFKVKINNIINVTVRFLHTFFDRTSFILLKPTRSIKQMSQLTNHIRKKEWKYTKKMTKCHLCIYSQPRCLQGDLSTIIHKIFETNSSFHVKQRTTGNFSFYFSRGFCQYQQNFHFGRKTGHQVIILSSLKTLLIFPNILRS